MDPENNTVDGVSTAIPAPVDTPVNVDAQGFPVDQPGKYKTVEEPDTDFTTDEVMAQFGGLFDGANLSDDFRRQAKAVFESAVEKMVAVRMKKLSEEADASVDAKSQEIETKIDDKVAQIEEQIGANMTELVEAVDKFMDQIAERYLDENQIGIESSVVVARAESMFEALQDIMIRHSIDIPDERIDALAEMEESMENVRSEANKATKENLRLVKENEELRRQIVIDECSKDLTDVQAERLNDLAKRITGVNESQFISDVLSLKRNLFETNSKRGRDFDEQTSSNVIVENHVAQPEELHVDNDNEVDAIIRGIQMFSR